MNKRLFIFITLSALLLSSCTEDLNPLPQEGKVKISFDITDNGYSSSISTRSADNGYTTAFVEGDCCGLYVIRDGKFIYQNIKLIAERDDISQKIVWRAVNDDIIELAAGLPDEQYFLYYPYDGNATNQTADISSGSSLTDTEFFAPLIESWQPEIDQSSLKSYAASDLMTAKGTAIIEENKTLKISFSMSHRMSLAIINMPKVVYKFSDNKVPDYTILTQAQFPGSVKPRLIDYSYRYIVNPNATSILTIDGFYETGKAFVVTPTGMAAGTYKNYNIEGATKTEVNYTIQRGDFLLEDGTLISKDATLTEEQKAKVAAIVFWTPADTDPTGRITPASLSDDKIRSKDYPHCTHGLAVALSYITNTSWQYPSGEFTEKELVVNYQNGSNFSRADKKEFAPIASLEMAEDDLNRILGYQNTQILHSYNEWCRTSGEGTIVESADALRDFINTYPAPVTSCGWYIPSIKELHLLTYKDIDDAYHTSRALKEVETASIIRDSYLKIKPQNLLYLYSRLYLISSTECPNTASVKNVAYFMDFIDDASFIVATKKRIYIPSGLPTTGLFPVCAF